MDKEKNTTPIIIEKFHLDRIFFPLSKDSYYQVSFKLSHEISPSWGYFFRTSWEKKCNLIREKYPDETFYPVLSSRFREITVHSRIEKVKEIYLPYIFEAVNEANEKEKKYNDARLGLDTSPDNEFNEFYIKARAIGMEIDELIKIENSKVK